MKKVYVDTSSLRAVPFKKKQMEELKQISSDSEFEVVLPNTVYREYLRQKRDELYDQVEKTEVAYRRAKKKHDHLIGSMKGFDVFLNENQPNLPTIDEIKNSLDDSLREYFEDFNILEDSLSVEDYKELKEKYFDREEIFEDSDTPREHLPDSWIAKEILNDLSEGNDNILVAKDKHLRQHLKECGKFSKIFETVDEFFKDTDTAEKITEIRRTNKKSKLAVEVVGEFKEYESTESELTSFIDNKLLFDEVTIYKNGNPLTGSLDQIFVYEDELELDFDDFELVDEVIIINGKALAEVDVGANIYIYDLPVLGMHVPIDDDDKSVDMSFSRNMEINFEVHIELKDKKFESKQYKATEDDSLIENLFDNQNITVEITETKILNDDEDDDDDDENPEHPYY